SSVHDAGQGAAIVHEHVVAAPEIGVAIERPREPELVRASAERDVPGERAGERNDVVAAAADDLGDRPGSAQRDRPVAGREIERLEAPQRRGRTYLVQAEARESAVERDGVGAAAAVDEGAGRDTAAWCDDQPVVPPEQGYGRGQLRTERIDVRTGRPC